jgi:hypothetical protein
MSLDNLDFINIAHGISNSRVYRIDREFFMYTATRTGIIPFVSITIDDMVSHILEILEQSWGQIDLMLNYKKYNKRKMKKLNNLLLHGDVELNKANIKNWITFLL